jgi:CHAT domain-containing protein
VKRADYRVCIPLRLALSSSKPMKWQDGVDAMFHFLKMGMLLFFMHALRLLMERLNPNHPNCASCYSILSGIYNQMGNYKLALKYRQKSIAVFVKTMGETHPDTAREYEFLGGIYSGMGDYDQAFGYLFRALKIQEKVLGTEHPDTASVYSRIGTLYGDMGDYADALVYGFRALRIREKVFGADHPDTALSLNEIGRVYGMLNDQEKCLEYQLRAMEITEKTFGSKHPKTARLYNNIGAAYGNLGDPDQSLEFELRALKIEEKALGTNHPSVAIMCHNIASTYMDLFEYEEALQYEMRAMDITEQVFGLDHPNAMPILHSFGTIFYELNQPERALECSLHALEVEEKIFSPDHPVFIDTYSSIALLYYEAQNVSAVRYAKKLMEFIIQSNMSVFYIPQEDLRLSLLNERRKSASLCFSVAFSNPAQFDEKELYAFELGTKNLVAESSFVQSSFARDNKKSPYADKYASLKHLGILYAKYSLDGFPETTKREVLEQQILDGEYALAPYYREIDFKLHLQQATPDAIREKLPDHAALLEYGRYYHFSTEPFSVVQQGTTDSYFVFVLTKDTIHLFDLADRDPIDALIDQARTLLTDQKDAGEALRSLYVRLIGPVENDLAEIDQLFIAPDSELFILPFELLRDEAGKRLSERIPSISYLSTGRDLLRSSNDISASPIKDIAIIADPKFDLDDGGFNPSEADKDTDRSVLPRRSRDVDEYLKASTIQRLPFTSVEADLIAGLFSEATTVQCGSYATKSSIRQLGPSSVVHLSTHGFALALQNTDIPQKRNLFGRTERGSQLMNAENPMLRCGLAFAGICNWLKGEILPVEIGDGILNGMDVLALDLSNTNLMVLSACQTGLGDTQSGEGIQGMRRAFELAGVHTLICTLWKVDDLASAILMTAFYKKLLENKLSKAAALSAAKEYTRTLTPIQLELDGWGTYVDDLLARGFEKEAMRLQDALDDEPDATPFAHPYYWAGFVLQGEA